jgi:N-methylhydantoinase B/oxoprolinase/acetone carboxylase alpha subunit
MRLQPGDVVAIDTPGGGGYGIANEGRTTNRRRLKG